MNPHPCRITHSFPRVVYAFFIAIAVFAVRPTIAWAIDTCYAVADDGDRFVSLNKITGAPSDIGSTSVLDIEAIAFQNDTSTLYAANGGQLGKINIVSGTYTAIGAFGVTTAGEPVPFDDVDGLSWDPKGNMMYGVLRRVPPSGSGLPDELFPDLLFQIDITTGSFKPAAFNGADFVPISMTTKAEADIDDIAFDPIDGTLYGIANDGGKDGTLVSIDKTSGAITEIGAIIELIPTSAASVLEDVIDDIEGLAFFNDGQLYGSTGSDGPGGTDENKLFSIDKRNGKATFVGHFPTRYQDYEALACLTANIADDDQDTIVNIGEDLNNDGNLANDNSDGDSLPNYLDPDDDNDGLATLDEDVNGNGNPLDDDTDDDDIANYLDVDDDGDGVPTRDEYRNNEGNILDDDSDGVPNYLEGNDKSLKGGDTDRDGLANQVDDDDDSDSILTKDEDVNQKLGARDDNFDGDTLPDYLDADDDNDGVPTTVEQNSLPNTNVDGDSNPNYRDLDSDGDSLTDNGEWTSDPTDRLFGCTSVSAICIDNDADDDDIPNFLDLDSDGDGPPDSDEIAGEDDDDDDDGIPDWLDAKIDSIHRIYMPQISR